MADIKITELPQATSVSDSDELIIQQPSGTKRAGIADLPVGSPLSAGDGIDITNDVVSNTKPMNYEITGSVPSPTPLNADQLQGHPASYFQKLLSAGNGINISNDVISSKLNMDLLWTNSSPQSNFVSQTISLSNINDYTLLMLVSLPNTNTPWRYGIQSLISVQNGGLAFSYSFYKMRRRLIEITSSGLLIGECHEYGAYAGTEVQNNGQLIPYKLFGIK